MTTCLLSPYGIIVVYTPGTNILFLSKTKELEVHTIVLSILSKQMLHYKFLNVFHFFTFFFVLLLSRQVKVVWSTLPKHILGFNIFVGFHFVHAFAALVSFS